MNYLFDFSLYFLLFSALWFPFWWFGIGLRGPQKVIERELASLSNSERGRILEAFQMRRRNWRLVMPYILYALSMSFGITFASMARQLYSPSHLKSLLILILVMMPGALLGHRLEVRQTQELIRKLLQNGNGVDPQSRR